MQVGASGTFRGRGHKHCIIFYVRSKGVSTWRGLEARDAKRWEPRTKEPKAGASVSLFAVACEREIDIVDTVVEFFVTESYVPHQYHESHTIAFGLYYICLDGRMESLDGAPPPALLILTSTMMLSRGPRVVGRAGAYRTPFASSLPVPRSWVSTSSNSIARFERFTTFTWKARAREKGR